MWNNHDDPFLDIALISLMSLLCDRLPCCSLMITISFVTDSLPIRIHSDLRHRRVPTKKKYVCCDTRRSHTTHSFSAVWPKTSDEAMHSRLHAIHNTDALHDYTRILENLSRRHHPFFLTFCSSFTLTLTRHQSALNGSPSTSRRWVREPPTCHLLS